VIEFFVYSKKEGLRRYTDTSLLPAFLKDEDEALWVDFEAPSESESEILSTVFNFHPLAIEDCIAESQLPKLDDYGDYLFIVVHGARRGDAPGTFNTVEVNFFVGKRFLVTFHPQQSKSIDQTKQRCQRNPLNISKGVDFLLHEVMDGLVDEYFPLLDDIDEVIDELEREAFESASKNTLDRVFALKRDVTALRRVTAPQREIFNRLSRDPFLVISRRAAPYFRDIYDHLFRIAEIAESYKELTGGLMEAYLMVVSNRLNEVMKVLTLLATIMLPLTVITGIYGMNFEFMPELKWRYGYFVILGAMGLVAGGLLLFFRKRKWI
jgi:magnesium transporter